MSYKVRGEVVRALRDARFMSQAELAERAHVSEMTVRRMESGRAHPVAQRTTVRKIAEALGVKPQDLVEYDDPAALDILRSLRAAV
jgi:DNA-binding Xre family transcriptional regulator